MAKMENYIFNVDAETSRAVDKLTEISNLMTKIDNIKNRGTDDYFTTNQKDMDKSMRSMSKLSKLKDLAVADLDAIIQKMQEVASTPIPADAPEEMQKAIRRARAEAEGHTKAAVKQQHTLQAEYKKTLSSFQALAQFQQNHSKNFKPVFMSNDLRNLPRGGATPDEQKDNRQRARKVVNSMANDKDPVTGRMDDVLSKIQEVNKLERRSESTSRRAAASNYMSYQQKSTFVDDHQRSQNQYKQERDQNMESITDIGQERTKLTNRLQDIKSNENVSQKELDEKVAIEATLRSMDEEWDKRMELNRVLERTIKNMEKYNESLHGVEVKPERGTFTGMMYERAPAIGLALSGAVAGTIGGMYAQGAGVNKGMRDDVVSIGQRTDSEDWRFNIRDEAFSDGMEDKLGFTGADMLQFQNNYMSNAGYEGMDDLRSAAENQARFSRVSGVDKEGTQQFFDAMYSTGAVNGDQTKDIQDAFIGGIKNSGMEGREKDQINALEGLLSSVKQGRSMTNDQVMNVMGLQSVLSGSGNRSLSGAQGGELLQGMNEGIRSGFSNPMVRLAMGQGTEYQGLEGRFALRERMDAGIEDIRNVTDIAKLAQSYMPNSEDGQNEVFASFVQEGLGTDITAEQSRGLMDLYREGALTEENIGSVLNQDMEKGAQVSEERFNEYQDSKEGTANQSDAVWEKQVANVEDLGDAFKALNSTMGGWKMGAYAATAAALSLAGAMAFAAASFGGSALLRRGMGQTYSATGGRAQRRRNGSGGGGTNGGGGGGGLMSRVGGWFGFGGGNSNGNGPNGNGPNGNGGGGGTGKWGKVGNIVGKAAVPLAVAGGIANYVAAPDDAKGEAAGSAIGGIGGGIAGGAATGALLGSVVPGIGTVIGGIGGGIAGGIAGSKLGGWIGRKFDGTPEEEAAAAAAAPTATDTGVAAATTAAAGVGAGASLASGAGTGFAAGTGTATMGTGMSTAAHTYAGTGGLAMGAGTVGTLGLATASNSLINSAESAPSGTPNVNEMNTQVERENTNRKGLAENQRTDNISAERENLTRYETLLDKAQQILNQARSQNGIFGSGTPMDNQSPVEAVLGGGDNADKIRGFLKQQGFTDEATAGVMGNLMQESGMDPTAVNPKSGAFGVGQWLGGRKTNLENYAKEKGKPVTDLGTQLEFLMKELQGGDARTKEILDQNGGLTALKGSSDVKQATKLFENAFERSGNDAMDKRYNYANGFYAERGSSSAQWSDTGSKTNTAKATAATSKVESTINVVVKADEKVSDKVRDSKDMKLTGARIQQQVYESMGFYSREMRMS